MTRTLVLGEDVFEELVRERKRKGIDLYDEVWDGVCVMPSMPNLAHQRLVHDLEIPLDEVVVREGHGDVYPGANVSDRQHDWKENYRVPDIVVVLKGGRAIDCGTHLFGGPDFLVEIQSPGDDTNEKLPFYSGLEVRELLIVHRDTRQLRLLQHNGLRLVPTRPSLLQGKRWLLSSVLHLAFRRIQVRGQQRTEVWRTDDRPGHWTV